MIKKSERTLEMYKRAGAEMRLLKALEGRIWTGFGNLVSAQDQDKLLRAFRAIDAVCSNAEDNMFRDYPELGSEYTDVFYGATSAEPRNSLDEEILAKAKETADGLFREKH